jgi:hypothetical protein
MWIRALGGIVWWKKTKGRQSRDTVPIKTNIWFQKSKGIADQSLFYLQDLARGGERNYTCSYLGRRLDGQKKTAAVAHIEIRSTYIWQLKTLEKWNYKKYCHAKKKKTACPLFFILNSQLGLRSSHFGQAWGKVKKSLCVWLIAYRYYSSSIFL